MNLCPQIFSQVFTPDVFQFKCRKHFKFKQAHEIIVVQDVAVADVPYPVQEESVHVNIKFLVAVREPVTLELVELYVFESNVFRTLNLDSCTSAARKNRTYFPDQ